MCWGVSTNHRPQAASCGLFAAHQGGVGGGLAADRPRTSSAHNPHNPHPALPQGRAFLPGGRLVLGDRRTTEERSLRWVGFRPAKAFSQASGCKPQATGYRPFSSPLGGGGRRPEGVVRRGAGRPQPATNARRIRCRFHREPNPRACPRSGRDPGPMPDRVPSSFGRKLPTTHRRCPSRRLSRAGRNVRPRIQSGAGPGSSPGQVRNLGIIKRADLESVARSSNGDDGVSVHPRPTVIRSPTSALCASPGMTKKGA